MKQAKLILILNDLIYFYLLQVSTKDVTESKADITVL